MKVYKEYGHLFIEVGDWMLDLTQEWSEWFTGAWNWKQFTLIKVYYEDEVCMGHRELQICSLGLGLRIVYIYDHEAEKRVEIHEALKSLEERQTDRAEAVTP